MFSMYTLSSMSDDIGVLCQADDKGAFSLPIDFLIGWQKRVNWFLWQLGTILAIRLEDDICVRIV